MKDVDGDGWHSYVYWSHSFRHGQPAIVRRALEVSRPRVRGVRADHAPPSRTKPDKALNHFRTTSTHCASLQHPR